MGDIHLTPPAPDQDWSRLLGVDPASEGDPVSATELAAHLTGRLCHDLIASGERRSCRGIDLIGRPLHAADMKATTP